LDCGLHSRNKPSSAQSTSETQLSGEDEEN
jgi:hypothetical protein